MDHKEMVVKTLVEGQEDGFIVPCERCGIRLVCVWDVYCEQYMRNLGLDPNDNTPREVYAGYHVGTKRCGISRQHDNGGGCCHECNREWTALKRAKMGLL